MVVVDKPLYHDGTYRRIKSVSWSSYYFVLATAIAASEHPSEASAEIVSATIPKASFNTPYTMVSFSGGDGGSFSGVKVGTPVKNSVAASGARDISTPDAKLWINFFIVKKSLPKSRAAKDAKSFDINLSLMTGPISVSISVYMYTYKKVKTIKFGDSTELQTNDEAEIIHDRFLVVNQESNKTVKCSFMFKDGKCEMNDPLSYTNTP